MNVLISTVGSTGALYLLKIINELQKQKKVYNAKLYEKNKVTYLNIFALDKNEAILYVSNLEDISTFKRVKIDDIFAQTSSIISASSLYSIEDILNKFDLVYFSHRDPRDIVVSFMESSGAEINENLYKADIFAMALINLYHQNLDFFIKHRFLKPISFKELKLKLPNILQSLSDDIGVDIDIDGLCKKLEEKNKDVKFSLNRKGNKFDKFVGKFDSQINALFYDLYEKLKILGYENNISKSKINNYRLFDSGGKIVYLNDLKNIVVYGGGFAYVYGLKDILPSHFVVDDENRFKFLENFSTLKNLSSKNCNFIIAAMKMSSILKMNKNLIQNGVKKENIFSILPIKD